MATSTATAMHASCWRCQAPAPSMVCASCAAPQPVAPGTDAFGLLGLSRGLAVDLSDLEARYHALSRLAHPDRHQTAEAQARQLSLSLAAELNRAYRTLRDPVERGRYWLSLHGRPLGRENNGVPATLAALVFDSQEQLEALREAPSPELHARVVALRDELRERIAGLEADLLARYATWRAEEAAGDGALSELRTRLSELAYLGTLLEDVSKGLGS